MTQPNDKPDLARILAATATGVWTWNVATDGFDGSEELDRIAGLEPGRFAGTGEAFFALVHEEDRARVRDAVLSAVRTRELYSEEFRIVRPDGSVRWVMNRGRVVSARDAGSEVVAGTITDITDRLVPADALLRAREARLPTSIRDHRFRMLADNAPALLWVTDEQHQCVYLSRGWQEYTGQSQEDGAGMGWVEPVHAEDRERAARIFLDAAARRAPFSLDYRLRRSDGEYRWAIDSGQPYLGADGEFLGYVGSVIDVHERKLAEEQLRGQAALIEGISTGTQDLIAAQDSEYRYIYFNEAYKRAFESLWGKQLEVGTSMIEALADWPDERDRARELWSRAHAGETFSITTEFGPEDGNRQTFDLRFHPVLDESGRQIGAAHILRDVTAQKAAEEKLRRADRQKDVFLATLAHELRNPLAPILTATRLLAEPDLEASRVVWARGVIERQAKTMALLLDDLLDVARITQGKLTLKRERVDLASAVDAAIETARPLIDRHEHVLAVDLPEDSVYIDADALRVSQILSNLLTNAAKYTDPGGRIAIAAKTSGDTVEIAVRDDGIGIEPGALSHLFETFSQVDDARSDGGLGIGLALVKGLTELHGGRIEAHSEGAGQGSTFTISLPIAVTDPHEATVSTTASEPARTGRRVLVADDNRDGADALSMLLRVSGHDVRAAYDGRSAIAIAEAFRPEIAILDIGMPDIDGYDVARSLRAESWASGLTLIALTGWGQEEDRAMSKAAGFDHHFTKPVDTRQLESLLRRDEPA